MSIYITMNARDNNGHKDIQYTIGTTTFYCYPSCPEEEKSWRQYTENFTPAEHQLKDAYNHSIHGRATDRSC